MADTGGIPPGDPDRRRQRRAAVLTAVVLAAVAVAVYAWAILSRL